MTQRLIDSSFGPVVRVHSAPSDASILLVCEHAANAVPDGLHRLGVGRDVLESHVAWDPGALGVALALAARLGAPLVQGCVSRLVYDCNRPPEARDAIAEVSEIHAIPGNSGLSAEARAVRIEEVYQPFCTALADEIANRRDALAVMITVHSFTPVYRSVRRDVEIGILHGRDRSFAEAMMRTRPAGLDHVTRLNEPYSATDGVAHTLDLHGAANALASVMLEIRNDLITTPEEQVQMAELLAPWIRQSQKTHVSGAAA